MQPFHSHNYIQQIAIVCLALTKSIPMHSLKHPGAAIEVVHPFFSGCHEVHVSPKSSPNHASLDLGVSVGVVRDGASDPGDSGVPGSLIFSKRQEKN